MAGVGVNGGYGPVTINGVAVDYPPGPYSWNAGQTWPLRTPGRVYANDLNEQLSQPVAFLARKPMFQGSQTQASQSIPANAWTPVNLDTEIADGWNMHQNSSDTSQVVIPPGCDGIWFVQGSVPVGAVPAGNYIAGAGLQHNGSVYSTGEYLGTSGSTIRLTPGAADLISLSAGDSLQLVGYQNYTSALDTYIYSGSAGGQLYDNAYPVLTARWVGAINSNVPNGVYTTYKRVGTWLVSTQIQLGIPSPGTWTANEQATASQFNSDIQNPVLFLSNVPAFRATASGTRTAIASGSSAAVTGLAGTIDNWTAFNSSTGTWTCPLPGLYLVGGIAAFPAQSAVLSTATIIHAVQSGTTNNYQGANTYSYWPQAMILKTLRFTAGDTVQLYAYQDSGSSLTPGTNSRMFTLWLSS